MEVGDLLADATDLPGPTGFLHVRFPNDGFEVAGLRVPCYKKSDQMMRYWERLTEMLTSTKSRPMVVAGDINLNVRQPQPKYKGKYVQEIESNWTIANPTGPGSFVSKKGKWFNIDHAFVSKRLKLIGAEYMPDNAGYLFASSKCDMSDHAVLVVDVEVGQRDIPL